MSAGAPLPCPASLQEAGLPNLVGRYAIRERIGQGAMADVYRAFDPNIQRELAIKVLRGRAAPATASTHAASCARPRPPARSATPTS